MAQLKVRIEPADDAVDDGAPFAGSVVHVVLRGTSEADALHPLVAETTGTVEDGLGGELVLDIADDRAVRAPSILALRTRRPHRRRFDPPW